MKTLLRRLLNRESPRDAGIAFARRFCAANSGPAMRTPAEPNPLEAWFDAHTEGAGVWKWRHYFELYHRHLAKFRNRPLVVLEIGIFSGGSIDLWREYFGPGLTFVGVDIEPACKSYERPGVSVLIGDQGDSRFWREAIASGVVPAPDVILDDGSHLPEHQRATLEELLPHLKPGGVYVCEDIHGRANPFAAFAHGVTDELNAALPPTDTTESRAVRPITPLQSVIHSVHFYPFVVVIERREEPLTELASERHGTQWQPFLSL